MKKLTFIASLAVGIALAGCSDSQSMVGTESGEFHECHICELHFTDKDWAKKCIEWCKNNESCNLEIAGHSEEAGR